MIRDRVMAGLDRARSLGKRLGRPRTTPFKIDRIRAALDEGCGVRETARLLKISAAKVSEVRLRRQDRGFFVKRWQHQVGFGNLAEVHEVLRAGRRAFGGALYRLAADVLDQQ